MKFKYLWPPHFHRISSLEQLVGTKLSGERDENLSYGTWSIGISNYRSIVQFRIFVELIRWRIISKPGITVNIQARGNLIMQ